MDDELKRKQAEEEAKKKKAALEAEKVIFIFAIETFLIIANFKALKIVAIASQYF